MISRTVAFTGKQKCELQEIEVADPGPNEVLVRSDVTLISTGTECICYRGEFDEGSHWHGWVQYPFFPGYSNSGRVEAVGKDVSKLKVGDRIFTCTGHRELFLQSEAGGYNLIPEDIQSEVASWSKLAAIAQTGVRRAEIELGDTVAVVGLGPLGQLVSQYARVAGAENILAIDPVQGRLDVAMRHGATHTFCGNADKAKDFVEAHTDGELADVVFDVTGHFSVFPQALSLPRRFGTMMLVGDSPHPSKQHLTADLITRQLQVRGSHNESLPADKSKWDMHRQVDFLYTLIQREQMCLHDLISDKHAPETAPDVYAGLLSDRSATMGVAFDWRN
jgi:2-desacetyl-2-hydroxyethyl bacteriochlorophyllide A dehydrogenase